MSELNMRKKQNAFKENQNSKSNSFENEEKTEPPNLKGDLLNISLLSFLYLLQGIPLGLTSAIPMLLQNRNVSYTQQAEFSFAYWPFSLKLLWAPIVDSLFYAKFGRRKSWLVPTQYLIGLFMMVLSYHVDQWLGTNGGTPDIKSLTFLFFILNFLAATQDIAVDGWALTMLKRCNVSYASTCNSVGQTAGYFFGYVVFIALESKDFCNSYLRDIPKDYGFVTLPEFLWFWGVCFFVTTTLVAILKREVAEKDGVALLDSSRYTEHPELDIYDSYKILINILKMRPIQILAVILLTVKVTFSASDAVSSLKLIDAGVPKEKLALLAIPIIPLQIILPLIISRYTNGPKPMRLYIKAIPYRMAFAVTAMIIVNLTPYIIRDNVVPFYYYVMLVLNYAVYQIFLYMMFVSIMAFFAKISDPAVGGTYMTLLNTVSNLGGNWPNTVVLWLVDSLTWRKCVHSDNKIELNNSCITPSEQNECVTSGGHCDVIMDGYYIESVICVVYGFVWLYFGRKWVNHLQNLPTKEWLVIKTNKIDHKLR